MQLKGKLLVFTLAVAAVLLAAQPGQLAASTATRNWKVDLNDPTTLPWNKAIRGLAVDQTNGDIYVAKPDGTIEIFDKDGVSQRIIGPTIASGTGGTPFTINQTSAQYWVNGLAVDPVTGCLFVEVGSWVYAVVIPPKEMGMDPLWMLKFKGSFAATGGRYGGNIGFSDDGMWFYSFSFWSATAGDRGVRMFSRNDGGTPLDISDDTFTEDDTKKLNGFGFLATASVGSPYAFAIDRNGKVYMTDTSTTKRPIRRYIGSGSNQLDMEFYHVTSASFGCSTDASNNFWIGDYNNATNRLVRCYSEGQEVFNFDPLNDNGGISNPHMVACDRLNNRVIVAGANGTVEVTTPTATQSYLQSWSVTLDTVPQRGTITGRVVDAATQTPVTNLTGLSVYSPYGSSGLALYSGLGTGIFSFEVNPGIYNVKASGPGYLPSAVSHYNVASGATVTTADIPLLPATSGYVTISLGEHNVEQGLFMNSTDPAVPVATPDGQDGRANVATTIGGRECRAFGPVGTATNMRFMLFDIDSGFMYNAAGVPVWIEADIYDIGYDRWQAQFDTLYSAVTSMGWISKTGTSTWQTVKWARSDARCKNTITGGGDLRLGSMLYDSSAPEGIDYVSKVTIRTSVDPAVTDSWYDSDTKTSIIDARRNNRNLGAVLSDDEDPGAANGGGTPVKLMNKVVTVTNLQSPLTNYPFAFYISDLDGSAGIKVLTSTTPPAVGTIVDVRGSVQADPKTLELCVLPSPAPVTGLNTGDTTTLAFDPIGMINRAAGGGNITYSHSDGSSTWTNQCQVGVNGSSGPSNIGRLVKVWGKVMDIGTDPVSTLPYAYIDDGSGIKADDPNVGVKLIGEVGSTIGSLQVGQYVEAVGSMSMATYDPTPGLKDTTEHIWDEYRYGVVYCSSARVIKQP